MKKDVMPGVQNEEEEEVLTFFKAQSTDLLAPLDGRVRARWAVVWQSDLDCVRKREKASEDQSALKLDKEKKKTAETEKKNEQMEKEKAEMKQKMEEMEKENTELKQKNEQIKKEKAETDQKIEQTEKEKAELKQMVEHMTKDLEDLRAENAKKDEELRATERARDKALQELRQMAAQPQPVTVDSPGLSVSTPGLAQSEFDEDSDLAPSPATGPLPTPIGVSTHFPMPPESLIRAALPAANVSSSFLPPSLPTPFAASIHLGAVLPAQAMVMPPPAAQIPHRNMGRSSATIPSTVNVGPIRFTKFTPVTAPKPRTTSSSSSSTSDVPSPPVMRLNPSCQRKPAAMPTPAAIAPPNLAEYIRSDEKVAWVYEQLSHPQRKNNCLLTSVASIPQQRFNHPPPGRLTKWEISTTDAEKLMNGIKEIQEDQKSRGWIVVRSRKQLEEAKGMGKKQGGKRKIDPSFAANEAACKKRRPDDDRHGGAGPSGVY